MALTDTGGLTIEDLEAMPDDGCRYELLGGSIVANGAPSPGHQWASSQLHGLLRDGCPPGHRVYYSPIDLDLVGEQRIQPDLVVVPNGSIGEKRLSLPVLLVVELVSPCTALWDTVSKRDAYAEAGIEHYWMVDTRKGQERFTALTLRDGVYETSADSTERIDVEAPVTISVALATLFEPPA